MYRLDYQLDDFAAAHRLTGGYQGKCAHLHGHNYRVAVTLACRTLNQHDMVSDFSDIKHCFNQWIKKQLDHATLVSNCDKPLLEFLKKQQQKHFLFEQQTTLENLAQILYQEFLTLTQNNAAFTTDITLQSVTAWESSRASITYQPDNT